MQYLKYALIGLFCVLLAKIIIKEPSYSSVIALGISGLISMFSLYMFREDKFSEYDKKIKEIEEKVLENEKLAKEARTYTSSVKISQQFSGKN